MMAPVYCRRKRSFFIFSAAVCNLPSLFGGASERTETQWSGGGSLQKLDREEVKADLGGVERGKSQMATICAIRDAEQWKNYWKQAI
jgi:hypothetical protein